MTEKQEQYKNNAQAVGAIPTHEDWGTSNGRVFNESPSKLTAADVANYLYEESNRQGIEIEALLSQITTLANE